MDSINNLYSTYTKFSEKKEYDLTDLGLIKPGGDPIMSILSRNRKWSHVTTAQRPTTLNDYDELFIDMITKLDPIYKLDSCLDYHYNNYLNFSPIDNDTFTIHLRYVILPKLSIALTAVKELLVKWLEKRELFMNALHQQQKVSLLKRAYDEALTTYPSSPLSVWINVAEIAFEQNIEISTAKRIINELVSENLATSVLGMSKFMITDLGREFLQSQKHPSKNLNPTNINFQVGNNSSVQFQNDSHNSVQHIETHEFKNEDVLNYLREIKENIEVLRQHLSEEKLNTLIDDTNYLQSALQRKSADKSVVKPILKGIVDIIKSVPGNLIANILTNQIPI